MDDFNGLRRLKDPSIFIWNNFWRGELLGITLLNEIFKLTLISERIS